MYDGLVRAVLHFQNTMIGGSLLINNVAFEYSMDMNMAAEYSMEMNMVAESK